MSGAMVVPINQKSQTSVGHGAGIYCAPEQIRFIGG